MPPEPSSQDKHDPPKEKLELSQEKVDPIAMRKEGLNFCEIDDASRLLHECRLDEDLAKSFVPKRQNYIGWEETFMGMALLAAQRSKDPNTQVGCAIVRTDNILNSIGYNGMPRGCDDDQFPWGKDSRPFLNKHSYVCHAEENAILNAKDILKGNILYTTLFPCNKCAKMIIQVGIEEVVYKDSKPDDDEILAAKLMFSKAGTKIRRFVPPRKEIILKFE